MSTPLRVVLGARVDRRAALGIAEVLSELPAIGGIAPGTQVVIVGRLASPVGFVARLFGGRKTIPRAVRSSALLARGFVDIAAAIEGDEDLVWGYAPPP